MKPRNLVLLVVALNFIAAIVFMASRPQRLVPTSPERQSDVVVNKTRVPVGTDMFKGTELSTEKSVDPAIHLAHAAEFGEIEKLSDAERRRRLSELFQEWVLKDALEAANFVLTVTNEDVRKEAMLRVMQAWAAHDPTAALAWAKGATFDNAYERDVAMSMACTEVANSDPVKAIALSLEYEVSGNDGDLIEGLVAKWTDKDSIAASKWALAQPDSEWHDRLVQAVGLEMFNKDPEAATRFILDEIPAGKKQNDAVLALVTRLASLNFDDAMSWVKAFPAGPLQNQALTYLQGVSDTQQN